MTRVFEDDYVGQTNAVCPYCGFCQDEGTYEKFIDAGFENADGKAINLVCEACAREFLVEQVVNVTYDSMKREDVCGPETNL